MKSILGLLSIASIAITNSIFGSELSDVYEMTFLTIPVIEVSGDLMPGWEKQIIEYYHDEEGNPMPVIFRKAARNWEAASWTPEYFAEQFGDEVVVVVGQNVLEDHEDYDKIANITGVILTTMKDHINDILFNSKNAGYLFAPLEHNTTKGNYDTRNLDKEFEKNMIFVDNHLNLVTQTGFPQSEIKPNAKKRVYFLFIGSENTVTSLHSHGSTFIAQIYGKKTARLIHPKYIQNCSCSFYEDSHIEMCKNKTEASFESPMEYIEKCSCPLDKNKYEKERDPYVSKCTIDITKPDFEKYPELKDIEVQESVLEPGDVLYVPDGWPHDLRSETTSITISSGF